MIEHDLFNKLSLQGLWKNVNDNYRAIQCDLCNYWININDNNFNYIDYKFLENSNDPWYCILCCIQIFLFNSMKSNKDFSICVRNFHSNNKPVKTLKNESSLSLNDNFIKFKTFSESTY